MFDKPADGFTVWRDLYVPKAGLPFHKSYSVVAPIGGQDMQDSFAVRDGLRDGGAIRGKRQRAT